MIAKARKISKKYTPPMSEQRNMFQLLSFLNKSCRKKNGARLSLSATVKRYMGINDSRLLLFLQDYNVMNIEQSGRYSKWSWTADVREIDVVFTVKLLRDFKHWKDNENILYTVIDPVKQIENKVSKTQQEEEKEILTESRKNDNDVVSHEEMKKEALYSMPQVVDVIRRAEKNSYKAGFHRNVIEGVTRRTRDDIRDLRRVNLAYFDILRDIAEQNKLYNVKTLNAVINHSNRKRKVTFNILGFIPISFHVQDVK